MQSGSYISIYTCILYWKEHIIKVISNNNSNHLMKIHDELVVVRNALTRRTSWVICNCLFYEQTSSVTLSCSCLCVTCGRSFQQAISTQPGVWSLRSDDWYCQLLECMVGVIAHCPPADITVHREHAIEIGWGGGHAIHRVCLHYWSISKDLCFLL